MLNSALRTHLLFIVCCLLLNLVALAQPNFPNLLPIPPILDANNGVIELDMRRALHMFNPASPSSMLNGQTGQGGITAFCYSPPNDTTVTILGPTLKWHTGDSVHIRVRNLLGEGLLESQQELFNTTTHWHGAEVPAWLDGGPHQPIVYDSTWKVDFKVLDAASTLWYHPHYHDHTLEHVQMGLSGMVIVEDNNPMNQLLPHTYGVDDIPLVIGDVNVSRDTFQPLVGADSVYILIDTVKSRRPFNLVNGINSPYVELPASWVRLRVLNGSTRKGVKFGVSDGYNYLNSTTGLLDLILVATDGGYTIKPDTVKHVTKGPGARNEVLLDLRGKEGQTLYLNNLKDLMPGYIIGSPELPPGQQQGSGQDTTIGAAYLKIMVKPTSTFPNFMPVTSFTPLPITWDPGIADTSGVSRHRTKNLEGGSGEGFTIDGTHFHLDIVDDTVCVGAKEIWSIVNNTSIAHPFHIHKIQFRVLGIDTLESGSFVPKYYDSALDALGLNGPKDDVLVLPNWRLHFLAKFDDYPTPIRDTFGYMYHCHILTHEDSIGGGMMHQFVVTDEQPCMGGTPTEEQLTDHQKMLLYPNPTTAELFLKGKSNAISTLDLYDMQGRRLRHQQLPVFEGDVPVHSEGLLPGIYLLKWEHMGGGTISMRFVVM